MGFEAFEVHLYPIANSHLHSTDQALLDELVSEIRAEWPEFQSDEVEAARLFDPLLPTERLLVYETSKGLIQLSIQMERSSNSIVFSLRFAYCNPRSVYIPFCDMVAWLMQCHQLYCHVVPDLAPQQQATSDHIDSPDDVCSILIPSMDYNRRLWQLDADTEEEAILRPGDAIARFMTPRFIPQGLP